MLCKNFVLQKQLHKNLRCRGGKVRLQDPSADQQASKHSIEDYEENHRSTCKCKVSNNVSLRALFPSEPKVNQSVKIYSKDYTN